MKKCSVDGCEKESRASGLCIAHYSMQRRRGTTERQNVKNDGLCTVCNKKKQRLCNMCQECYQVYKYKNDIDYKMRAMAKGQRYRANKRNAKTEVYSVWDVYKKTGGKCALCGEEIDLGLREPKNKTFSIDHILPLSKGGSDLLSNVQPAHFGCNSRKNNRVQEK